jgi:hypothetical protein
MYGFNLLRVRNVLQVASIPKKQVSATVSYALYQMVMIFRTGLSQAESTGRRPCVQAVPFGCSSRLSRGKDVISRPPEGWRCPSVLKNKTSRQGKERTKGSEKIS